MIELLKLWVTSITIAVFFITAVEMILPDNSMKKYAKFVLGLLLIVVIIKPIIKIFDKDFNISAYSGKVTSYMETGTSKANIKKYKDSNILNTAENFKKNLENQCITNLEETYPENKYNADIDVVYDSKNGVFNINTIGIGVIDPGVKRINNIEIDSKSVSTSKKDVIEGAKGNKIKNLISSKFKISNNIITVYKSNS
ncbi:stage III sporulation protein AF [Clostridium lacusfryxellense]|uniref:stage III sporulation protein AF n=1 Tax=Clostridium lacusfryxellense TaxID=205328 RepID=UPI001C0C61D3|nr:stage III sporulation protein AF [Clostridium lacusfryxellense]MBU3110668.1 stage III sporulation protein AF [Clostridium lacusfryxellense]